MNPTPKGDRATVVYTITHRDTKRVYVGKTVDARRRFKNHIFSASKPDTYIARALAAYGIDAFDFVVVVECPNNAAASEMERRMIAELKTRDQRFGFNLTDGGDGAPA